ncbi:MAG: SBBP repeat-containing protein, partial [Candidatus Magasanikbacteria bacterium]|nr:SBBP repeat-containing protein [Candidatus Magasanikbacteria bacterium]
FGISLLMGSFLLVAIPVQGAELSTLGASTFLGGTGKNLITSMTFDASGNVVVAGHTDGNFPSTAGAYDVTYNGPNPTYGYSDGFVAKLSPDLSKLLSATYLGGSQGEVINAMAIDTTGNVIVVGSTFSKNFPVSATAFDTSLNGYEDGFVSILSADLKQLIASTYVGGDEFDAVQSITRDSLNNIFIAGRAESNFPVTVAAYDTSYNGDTDGFIAKLSSTLTNPPAVATYVGGNYYDIINQIVFSQDGQLYAVGNTMSNNFPTTANAFDKNYNGNEDGFVLKIHVNLSGPLLGGTYLGGEGNDRIRTILAASDGAVFVGGDSSMTGVSTFPTTPGSYDQIHKIDGPAYKGFITKFNSTLSGSLLASTYLGGSSGNHEITTLVQGPLGTIYVAGKAGAGFPVTSGSYDTSFNGDEETFIAQMKTTLTEAPIAATYLGGSLSEGITTIASDSSGKLYVAGSTQSYNFPITQNAYDKILNPDSDAFVAYFSTDFKVLPLSNPPEVKKGSNLQVIASGILPDSFISSFLNLQTNTTVTLSPLTIAEKNGYTLILYDTNTLLAGSYKLKIEDQVNNEVLAESDVIQVVPENIVYKLNVPKTAVGGDDVVIKVYPGLYAYDKLISGEYALVWKNNLGNSIALTPKVWPTKGFTLLLPFTYNTAGLAAGTYTIELKENTKLGNIFTSATLTITKEISKSRILPAYNPKTYQRYQQSLKNTPGGVR